MIARAASIATSAAFGKGVEVRTGERLVAAVLPPRWVEGGDDIRCRLQALSRDLKPERMQTMPHNRAAEASGERLPAGEAWNDSVEVDCHRMRNSHIAEVTNEPFTDHALLALIRRTAPSLIATAASAPSSV